MGASPETVGRGGVVKLHRGSRVEKTWGRHPGGPGAAGAPWAPPAFAKRLAENRAEKRAIRPAEAARLSDGEVVLIEGGAPPPNNCASTSTTKRIRIITNSMVMAQAVERPKG